MTNLEHLKMLEFQEAWRNYCLTGRSFISPSMTHTQTDTETGENAVQVLEEQAVRAFDAYCAQIGRSELTDREIALLFRMLRAFAVGLEGGR